MKYLKISNRGSLNRKYLELIGLSTKRDRKDDDSVIGHKGSGTKLSAVAALRLNMDVAIASTDRWGRYLLTFDVEDVDIDGTIARQIHFTYRNIAPGSAKEDRLRYPSGMVLEAFQDWDRSIGDDDKESFKVLREFVCNAVDASVTDNAPIRLEVVDRPAHAVPGETAVYLKYTDEVRQILAESDRYFKFLSKTRPLYEVKAIGAIYPKSERGEEGFLLKKDKPPKTRLFVQGVLVDCDKGYYRSAVYDYSMHRKTLVSEERIIKSFTEYQKEMAKLFGQLTDAEIAKHVLSAAANHKAQLEEQALGQVDGITPASKRVWVGIAEGLFGKNLAVSSGNTTIDKDCNQIYGYTVIGSASTYLRGFYAKLGLPKAEDIVPTGNNMKYRLVAFDELDEGSRERLVAAHRKLAMYFPERASLPIVLYEPLDENFRKLAGFSGVGDAKYKEMWVAVKPGPSLGDEQDVFHTLLHEGRHCETKADDYERPFVRRADHEVIGLVYGRTLPPGTSAPETPPVVDPASRTSSGTPGPASAAPGDPEVTVIVEQGDPLDEAELQRMLDELAKDAT